MQADGPASAVRDALRGAIRDHYLAPEDELVRRLTATASLSGDARKRAQATAGDFVRSARKNTERSGLIDKFLQEYGLSSAEGVTLMRLAEALLRTPDATTANALIEDKIEAGDWAAHKGRSPFPIVNFSTRALMLTAAWLDDEEAKDPLRRMAAATKRAFDRLGEPVIRASVAQAMQVMGEHFVLGETIGEAMKRGRRHAEKGYRFSFDMLGEAAHTAADAERYHRDYEEAIVAIAKHADPNARASDNPGISVKLSALHPRYEFAKKERVLSELTASACALARQAKAANMGFNIDAEEADRLDLSLDIIEALMHDPELADWRGFGVVIQAYQRRASFVIDWLAALARETGRRVMVRLVKGAYWDAEIKRAQVMGLKSYPVFTQKVSTDLSYLACARKILASTDAFYPQFATHNALTAATVMEMANGYADYEFQRLHGMGEALHDSLIAHGAASRIYAPVGGHRELLPYLVRRLLENGANSSFVNQLIDPEIAVDDIVADPIEELAGLSAIANPAIPAPRDHLGGDRLSAKGWDETHPPTAAKFRIDARGAIIAPEAHPIVDGEPLGGAPQSVRNPAQTDDVVGTILEADGETAAKACAAAAAYAADWARKSPAERAAPLREAAALLETRAEKFMALAVFEAGKTWPDAIAEVREAVDFLRYYANEAERLPADAEPVGVVACISPWNFPLAIFLGQIAGALAAGNCVVAKPAEQTPLIAFEAVRLLHEAGVPNGALHFTPGDGPTVGASLVADANVGGVAFTGSVAAAHTINRTLADSGKPDAALIAETGGVNAMIIDSTALLEQATSDVVSSAFQSAGQRCSACRLVCVQEDIADRFEEMLAGAMAELTIGAPADLSVDVGPVIDAEALATIEAAIARLEREARLIARAPAPTSEMNGTFVRPVAFAVASPRAVTEEIFGPVLHVARFAADRLDALVDEINELGYGLTMGVHSRIDETMHAIAQRARIGNLYVNRNQIGAVVGVQPFGGEGLSGTGPKAGGPRYLEGLCKRPRPAGEDGPVPLADRAFSAEEKTALARAAAAYEPLAQADRASMLRSVGAPDDIVDFAAAIAQGTELPGPTGESNTLRLRGRGAALCLGPQLERQAYLCLAAGDPVVALDSPEAERLATALSKSHLPEGGFVRLREPVSEAFLAVDALRLVVCDGDAETRAVLTKIIAARRGPIIPLLSILDAPWRFAVERTLTVNTTAAGGDVRLLSLEG